MDDSWKGEHLIKTIKPAHKAGASTAALNRNKPKPSKKRYGTCIAPGCDNPLYSHNISHVCKAHVHSQYCECIKCLNRRQE